MTLPQPWPGRCRHRAGRTRQAPIAPHKVVGRNRFIAPLKGKGRCASAGTQNDWRGLEHNPPGLCDAEFGTVLRRQYDAYGHVIREANIKGRRRNRFIAPSRRQGSTRVGRHGE